MPKDLGIRTLRRRRIRSVQNFQITVGATDFMDVGTVVENRDPDNPIQILEVEPGPSFRFSQAEIEAILNDPAKRPEGLPDYQTLRLGLAGLIHAMVDARS